MLKSFVILSAILSLTLAQQALDWKTVSDAVSYANATDFNDEGLYRRCIVIAFGTSGADLSNVKTWIENLHIKRLKQFGFSHIYAVRGPQSVDYESDSETNKKLISDVLRLYSTHGRPLIVILAHGEGAYAANAFLENLRFSDYLNVHLYRKIIYFMLDGTTRGYHPDYETKLLKTFGVYAYSEVESEDESQPQRNYSRYYGSVAAINKKYPEGTELISVDASKSGCESAFCLQNALINKKPIKPQYNDIHLDYTKFGRDRRVVHEYLDVLERENL